MLLSEHEHFRLVHGRVDPERLPGTAYHCAAAVRPLQPVTHPKHMNLGSGLWQSACTCSPGTPCYLEAAACASKCVTRAYIPLKARRLRIKRHESANLLFMPQASSVSLRSPVSTKATLTGACPPTCPCPLPGLNSSGLLSLLKPILMTDDVP